jgi:hypothetical protein
MLRALHSNGYAPRIVTPPLLFQRLMIRESFLSNGSIHHNLLKDIFTGNTFPDISLGVKLHLSFRRDNINHEFFEKEILKE